MVELGDKTKLEEAAVESCDETELNGTMAVLCNDIELNNEKGKLRFAGSVHAVDISCSKLVAVVLVVDQVPKFQFSSLV